MIGEVCMTEKMHENNPPIDGVRIILNEDFPPNTTKPHYYLNKITRRIAVDSVEVSEDIYNELKRRCSNGNTGYKPQLRKRFK